MFVTFAWSFGLTIYRVLYALPLLLFLFFLQPYKFSHTVTELHAICPSNVVTNGWLKSFDTLFCNRIYRCHSSKSNDQLFLEKNKTHTQAVLRHRSGLCHTALHNDPYSQKASFNLGRARVAARLRDLSHCFISLRLFVYCPLSGVLSFLGGITTLSAATRRYAGWFDIEWRERILLSLGVEIITVSIWTRHSL